MGPSDFRPGVSRTALIVAATLAAAAVLLVAGAVFFRLNLTGTPAVPKRDHPMIGWEAPPYELTHLQENRVYNKFNFTGKVVVLNFWAMWCKPCIVEIPELAALADRYKDDPRFRLITVNCDTNKTPEEIKKFVAEQKWTVPVYLDADGISRRLFGIEFLPTTVVIDKDGVVRWYQMGVPPEGIKAIEEKVREALAPRASR